MLLCEGCAGAFDNAELVVTEEGLRCPECASKVVPKRKLIGAVTAAAVVVLILTFSVHVGWSSASTVNGVTESHAVNLQHLLGGPLAAMAGACAIGGGLLQKRPLDVGVSALVVLVAMMQLARGVLAL